MHRKLIIATLTLPAALFCAAGCHSSSSSNEQPAATSATAPPPNAPPASATATTTAPVAQTQPSPIPAAVPSQQVGSQAANSAPPPPPRMMEIPRGTVLHVRITQALGSKISEDGEHFDASLADPVEVDGHVVIPRGAALAGTVTQAHEAGRFKGGATLGLDLHHIRVNGESYPIHTALFEESRKGKGKRTAEFIGGGGGAGALIGGLAGGGKGALIGGLIGAGAGTAGAATGNHNIELPSETRLSFRLTEPLSIPAESR